ncbi:MAG: hypothetical protein ABRQ25_00365 [Clostridiaceae bacterium]
MPFNREYYISRIREYSSKISADSMGDFQIYKIDGISSPVEHYLFKLEERIKEPIVELRHKDEMIMRIDPLEIEGCYESIERARGRVGVAGLGLGYFVQEILKKPEVKEVIVYENSKEVIELYKRNFTKDLKLDIVHTDAFNAKGEEFDFFFVDIYNYSLGMEVVDDYVNFNEIHAIREYSFWGMERFLLSCRMEDLIHICLPEEWLDMTRDIYDKFEETPYFSRFKPMNERKVKKVLHAFNKVL